MATNPGRVLELPALHNRLSVFRDRTHAGEVLADMLSAYRGSNALVLGIPVGGAPVAAAIARALALPLDVAVVSKLTLPWNTEAGYGAFAFDDTLRLNEMLMTRAGLSEADIETGKARAQEKVMRRVQLLRGDRPFPDLSQRSAILVDDGLASGFTLMVAADIETGKARAQEKVMRRVQLLRGDRPFPDLSQRSAILVDDGLASGFTLMVAIEALRHQKAKEIVVAVPTAHTEPAARIAPLVEALYCPNLRAGTSIAVADAYQEWSDVAEEDLVTLLRGTVRY